MFNEMLPYQVNNDICDVVYGLQLKHHLWSCLSEALLCINMAENRNCRLAEASHIHFRHL
jgi:hypothetical protein